MLGHRPPYCHGGRGQQPQRFPPSYQEQRPELLNFNPNFFPLLDPNFLLHTFPNALPQLNFAMQNPNFPIQNPNFFLPPQQQEFHFQLQLHFHQHQPPQVPPPPPVEPPPIQPPLPVDPPPPLPVDPPPPIPPPPPPPPQEQQKQQQESPTAQQNLPKSPQNPKKKVKQNNKELQLERIDRAVEKARRDIVEAEESVSSWKVSQSALVNLQAESWDSLGFRMEEVPALFRLMVTEGKINAFIHCFVGVRRITSIYDLEVAICKNEGVENFEELGLGPLMRHPLVLHYFSMKSDASAEVFKITSEEIILWLSEFMDTCKKKVIIVDDFLYFLAKNYSVKGPEMLGVHVRSLGTHIMFIREAKASENSTQEKWRETLARNGTLKKFQEARASEPQVRPRRREGCFSSEKEKLEECFSAVRERVKSFSRENHGFGKHIIFVSSSSEDEKSDDGMNEDEMTNNNVGSHLKSSEQAISNSDQVSSCPYPSATEERLRLELKGEIGSKFSSDCGSPRPKKSDRLFLKKRKLEDASWNASMTSMLPRSNKKHVDPIDNCDIAEEFGTPGEDDISLSSNSLRAFITSWKEACKDYTVAEILERMLQHYKRTDNKKAARHQTNRRMRIVKWLFSSHPFNGMLNVAVTSIKCGMWDSTYDTLQVISQPESANTLSGNCSEYECIDVEPGEKKAPAVCECLKQTQSLTENDESLQIDVSPTAINEHKPSKFKLKASVSSCQPPGDLKTAPGSHSRPHSINEEEVVTETVSMVPVKNNVDFSIENNADRLPKSDNVDIQTPKFNGTRLGPTQIFRSDHFHPGTADGLQTRVTGREGEQFAFNYLTAKFGGGVKWVNQDNETGLPFDMVIEMGSGKEYIEVKATRSGMKDWFEISFREWQFAVKKGDSFTILHVLLGYSKARVTAFRNPARQCQVGKLRLAVLMPSVSETWEDVSLLT